MSPDGKRAPRADASRNAARLLAAARDLVEERGSDLVLDEVARRAGVGNATLYRHFPTRADLLAAVYAEEVDALCRTADDLLDASDPVDALLAWLDAFVVHVSTRRPLALAATAGPDAARAPLFDRWHVAVTAAADGLVRRAGPALRPGVATADVLTLATGAALAADTEHARRLVALLRTGLVADAG